MHILSNISKSKGIQTVKFGQLIGCNMKTTFSKNYAQNVVEKQVLAT